MAPTLEELQQIATAAVPTAGRGLVLDPFGRIPDGAAVYTDYTPTWTSTGTAPAIGNGVVIARYTKIGKLVHAHGRITFGSSSTYGTGTYSFALPVTGSANITILGSAGLLDSSASALDVVMVTANSTMTMALAYGATYLGTNTNVGQTAPWAWASGDQIQWNITYEAA